jgi:hypothetical protein
MLEEKIIQVLRFQKETQQHLCNTLPLYPHANLYALLLLSVLGVLSAEVSFTPSFVPFCDSNGMR